MTSTETAAEKAALGGEAEQALWRGIAEHGDERARSRLIEHYLSFARIIAAKLYANRHVNEIGFEEYMQFATVGLIEAVDRFDASRNVAFTTFASARIRGAVLNGLESLSEKQQQLSLRKRMLRQRVESLAGGDVEAGADRPFLTLMKVAIGLAVGYMLEGSGIWQEENEGYVDNIYGGRELRQLQETVRNLVEGLPEQEKRVIRSHYIHGVGFDEVSREMGVTRGRISQIHRKGLRLLKEAYDRTVKVDLRL